MQQLLCYCEDEFRSANVDRDYQVRQYVAAQRQRDGQVKAGPAADLGFAEVVENECVPAPIPLERAHGKL